jgi:hypothetical protein
MPTAPPLQMHFVLLFLATRVSPPAFGCSKRRRSARLEDAGAHTETCARELFRRVMEVRAILADQQETSTTPRAPRREYVPPAGCGQVPSRWRADMAPAGLRHGSGLQMGNLLRAMQDRYPGGSSPCSDVRHGPGSRPAATPWADPDQEPSHREPGAASSTSTGWQ